VVERFGAATGDEGGDVFGHEYVVDAGGAAGIGGRFIGGSEGEAVDVDQIVFREDPGETVHVETEIFVEVSAEDDLVAFVEFGLEV
jgi:hypothetical protein